MDKYSEPRPSSASHAFWNDPPWQNGNGSYQMQLKPLAESDWCKFRISTHEQQAKLRVLNEQFDVAVQIADDSSHAQQLLAAAVNIRHRLATPAALERSAKAAGAQDLLASALSVPADLCLMQKLGNTYHLVAACVCAPSYWYLPAKIGQSLSEIHQSVPGLNDALGARMNQFFDRLPQERMFTRRNWFIHSSSQRFQPKTEDREQLHTLKQAEALVVRSETQTLRRLSSTVIAFTIAVDSYPLSQIYGYKAAAVELRRALLSRSEDEKEAAGQPSYENAVLTLLRLAESNTPLALR